MVVPRLVSQALADKPLTVFGDGQQKRCFCHVFDVVEALLALIGEESAYGNVFNVGATAEISILELAERIIEMTGSRSDISLIPYAEAYGEGFEDMYRRIPDITKVQQLIGWRPARTLENIIQDVIDHQRSTSALETPHTGSTVGQSSH
jgi:UDP-glucose 4-epimerase